MDSRIGDDKERKDEKRGRESGDAQRGTEHGGRREIQERRREGRKRIVAEVIAMRPYI